MNLGQEWLAGTNHSAAEKDEVGVDRVHHADRPDGKVIRGFAHQPLTQGIARGGELRDRLACDLGRRGETRALPGGEGFLGSRHERRGGGIAFEVPFLSARADAAVFQLNDDVAALRAVAVSTFDQPPFFNDAAADPRTQGEKDEAPRVSPRARPKFAKGRGVAVVLEGCWFIQKVGEFLANGEVLPADQIGRFQKQTGMDIHCAGRTKADGRDVVPGQSRGLDSLSARLREVCHAELGTLLGVRRQADPRERPTVIVDDAALDIRASQVDPDIIRRGSIAGTHRVPRALGVASRATDISLASRPIPSDKESGFPLGLNRRIATFFDNLAQDRYREFR